MRQKTDLSSLLVDNTDEGLRNAIEFLNFKKKNGESEEVRQEAKRLLGQAEARIFRKNKKLLDMEFQGNLKDLSKREIVIKDSWTDEQKAQAEKLNEEIRKKRSNWRQKE